jgi:Circularly permutated YpsA SLOG family
MANQAQVIRRIVSGGQTGVDRAALDVGLGLACGGWCPRGRRAEDGPLDPRYPLVETPSEDYAERTAWNVRDSDATLVLTRGAPTGGTALAIEMAGRFGRPVRIEDPWERPDTSATRAWLLEGAILRLNVAGPRESGMPGIYREALDFLQKLLAFEGAPTPSP